MRKLVFPSLLLALAMPALGAPPAPPAPPPPAAAAPAAAPEVTRVLVLVYDGVELGDLAAPVEVFKVAAELGATATPAFQIRLAAEKPGPVQVDGGFSMQPDCVLAECPPAEILVLAGGRGALQAMNRPALVDWVRQRSNEAKTVVAVCTGTFLLAKAGLLDGLAVTTHKQGLGYLQHLAPKAKVEAGRHFVEAGKFVTTAGVSSTIDASLSVVGRYLGGERARATAEWLDHAWKPAAAAAAP